MKKCLPFLKKTTKRIIFSVLIVFLAFASYAQTEDFTGETIGGTTFTTAGVLFNMSGDLQVNEFLSFSCNNSMPGVVNQFMDTDFNDGGSSGSLGVISPDVSGTTFQLSTGFEDQCGWTGQNDGDTPIACTIRYTGTKPDNTTISEDIAFPGTFINLVPFTFSNAIWGGVDLVSLEIEIISPAGCDYYAMDDLTFANIVAPLPIVCPTVGAVSASETTVCEDDPFNVTATGLVNMDGASNNEQDFGIEFVAFTSTPADPYVGGTSLGTVPFGSLGGGGMTASLTGATLGTAGSYEIYAILSPTPTDGTCRPSAMTTITVNANPTVTMAIPAGEDEACVNDPIYAINLAGAPTGGVYSGAGVNDLGNGISFTFNPAVAGVGTHTVTYTLTQSGCTGSATDDITVLALPTVTFTALADLCLNDGVQAGLGGGTPTGGVYSGTGVTDDGNGMTYSFDPAAAGVGTHIITYTFTDGNGCTNSASDDVEVFAIPTAAFTAPADLCVNAGVQAGLGGGTPTGGVYSGAGVTDDGNGMTYSFDPAAAGVGTHTLTYTVGVSGCSDSATDDIEVFALPTVMMEIVPSNDVCVDAGVQLYNLAGDPTGGTYSGSGVNDLGTGISFTFDPAVAGVGTHTVTYTFTDANGCTNSATDDITVLALPTVTFTALADLCVNDGVQAGLGGGTPTGGVYSGPGVTDDGNGMTYSFDPAAAGVGTHTLMYTFTDGNGCTGSASDDVQVFALPNVTFTAPPDVCLTDVPITGLGGGMPTGGVYSGTGVIDDGNGMTYTFEPGTAGVGTHTITYTVGVSGCSGSAMDDIEVFALPTVTMATALGYCLDANIATAPISGGSPSGGVYSGPGVTDLGNGTTYNFDPMVAGVGVHTITYTFTDANGCTNSDESPLEVFDCEISITDPCNCLDNATVIDVDAGTGGDDGQFSEIIALSNAAAGAVMPPGQTWSVTAQTGAFDAYMIPPVGTQSAGNPVATDGSVTFTYDGVGVYELPFVHVDALGYSITVEGPFPVGSAANVTLTITNNCSYPNPVFDPSLSNLNLCAMDPAVTLGASEPSGIAPDGVTFTINGNPETQIDPVALGGGTHLVVMTYDGGDDGNGGIAPMGGTAFPGCIQTVQQEVIIDPICCMLEVTCPMANDLGSFDCTEIGNIPAHPTTAAEAMAAPYNITIGNMQCGTIAILCVDDITNYDVCVAGGQTVTRTITVFDDLDGGGTLDMGEESEVCTFTFTIEEDTQNPNFPDPSDEIINTSTAGVICPYPDASISLTADPGHTNPLVPGSDFIVHGATFQVPSNFSDVCDPAPQIYAELINLEVNGQNNQSNPPCTRIIRIRWAVVDACGNERLRRQLFFINDDVAPVPPAPPADFVGQCASDVPPPVDLTATDACQGDITVSPSAVITPGNCDNQFTMIRTWTFTDDCGNTSSVSQNITIFDDTPPDPPAPPVDIVGQCASDVPPPVDLTAQDNCDGAITVSPSAVITPGNCPNQFTMVRTWTFTDGCGNSSSVSQNITIFDDTPPVLSAMPASTTVECDAIPPAPVITATDNCASVAPVIFINEIHYDNDGGDVGEFIEVAGTAGFDLSACQLVLYNGSNSMVYNTMDLSGMIDDEGTGFGAVDFQYPSNGIQNGSPDGMALVCGGVVIQFLSYEGTITAVGGPADGMMSVDIGVNETDDPPLLQSLQLTGTGCNSGNFAWNPPAPQSPGTINPGQTFDLAQCQSSNEVPVIFTENSTPGACPQEQTITRIWSATDECGNNVTHTQVITVVDTTIPEFCNAPTDITVDCLQDVPVAEVLGATDNCDFSGMSSSVWINEFHYDNAGTDAGEFIEVAGVAGTDLSTYQLLLYNGSNGLVYNTMQLSGVIDNESCNRGALSFTYPVNGIQNGPDAIALVQGNTVIEFLSYEGSFTANDGPAMGLLSTNVGVSETSGTPVGSSLQLSGTGASPTDFVWTGPSAASPGSLNTGQIMQGNLIATLVEDNQATQCDGGTIIRTWTVEDACGNAAVPHVQTIIVLPPPPPVITCPADLTVACIDDLVLDPNDATATSLCGNIVGLYIKNPHITGVPNCDGTIYTYIYVAVDDCGRSSECEQQVLIENDPATIMVPAGGTVECFEDINISVDDATVVGACAAYNLYLVPPALSGPSGCPGTTYTYIYRMIDACGRTVEEPVVFTNGANAGPTIEAPLDVTCECLGGVNPNPDLATVSTSCSIGSSVTVTGPQIFGPVDCNGTVYRYTYTVTDDCGRTATDIQDFTVNNGPPVFENCPEDNWLVLNCEDYGGEDGTIDVIEAWIASVTASTSCGVPLTVFNNFNPNNINTCVNNGYNTVTFRATDNCGRSTFCTGVYVVVDTEAPEIIEEAQDHWEMCNYNTQANLDDWVAHQGGALASDGCSGSNISWQASPSNPTINCIGAMGTTSVTVTFIVTDNCGNKTSTTATFNALMNPDIDLDDPQDEMSSSFNDEISLFQNQPNPFKHETMIGFYLPEAMTASIVIYDISGKEIKRIEGDYAKGYNSLSINRSELTATGFLLYQLNTEQGSITKRMILIE